MTGTWKVPGTTSERNVEDLTESRVVMPKSLLGLNLYLDFSTSAMIGTTELTGLVMTRMNGSIEHRAIDFAISRAVIALSSNKSKVN